MKNSLLSKGVLSFLIIAMIILSSCNAKDVSSSKENNFESSTISKNSNSFENVFQSFIEKVELDVTQDEFKVINTQITDKGTTWRIKQQYKGIEVYNGDLLIATDTDDNIEYYTGTYFEKLDCIENFDAKVTSAKSMANWMENAKVDDNNWLKIDTSSLKPYIYVTEENEADIVRQFRIYYCIEGEYGNADVLSDINQGEIYDFVFNTSAYEPAVLEAPPYSVDVVKEGNIYYLYNSEHNYFVLNTEEIDQEKLRSYLFDDNGKSRIEYDFKNMKSTHQQTWKADFGRVIVQSMLTMNEVSDYWKTNYKVDGIYGDGSVYGLIVRNGYIQGTAMTLGGAIIACGRSKDYTHSIADAPEVLVHEFSHGILQNYVGISDSNGDPASLHEGISDIFAAVYSKDWSIGKGIDAEKDIAKKNYTMSDYLATDDFLSSWNYIINSLFAGRFISCTYHNSFIVSHTVYKIWKDIIDKDYDMLGNILFNSLKFMPNQPTFSDFAYAFIQSTEDLCGKSKADLCKKCFNTSGYKLNGNSVFYKTPVGRPRLVDDTENSASSGQPYNNFSAEKAADTETSFTYTNEEYGWSVEIPAIWKQYGSVGEYAGGFEHTILGQVGFHHKEIQENAPLNSNSGWLFDIGALPPDEYEEYVKNKPVHGKLAENSDYVFFYIGRSDLPIDPVDENSKRLLEEFNLLSNTRESILETFRLLE